MGRPVARAWSARPPRGQAVLWRTRRRIEATLVWFAGVDGALHGVIHLKDDPLGAVLSCSFIFSAHDWEVIHDVVHIVPSDAVEMEECSVHLAPYQEAPLLIPPERRAIVAAVFGEGGQVPGSVGEFEDAGEEPGVEGVGSRE